MHQASLPHPEQGTSAFPSYRLLSESIVEATESVEQPLQSVPQVSSTSDLHFTIPLVLTPSIPQTSTLPSLTSAQSSFDIDTIPFTLLPSKRIPSQAFTILPSTTIPLTACTPFEPESFPSLPSTLITFLSSPKFTPPLTTPLPSFSILNPNPTPSDSSPSPGAVAGITVGIISVAVLLCACVVGILTYKGRKKNAFPQLLQH
jgi:hypothetical protein